jgi:hypothetical protein
LSYSILSVNGLFTECEANLPRYYFKMIALWLFSPAIGRR